MMTDQQKNEIESLRKEGLSYRQIAERVGATHCGLIGELQQHGILAELTG